MQIAKPVLVRRWAITVTLALIVFAALGLSELRLRALSGISTTDLQAFASAGEYRVAFFVWRPQALAVQAGFDWGLDYLFMPLYAAAFFYSGILARETFVPCPGRLRRIVTLLAAVPIAGALLDGVENALQIAMILSAPTDSLARLAFTIANAKMAAIYVGLALLAAAVLAQLQERQKQRLRRRP